ncbi:hypothetical protein Pmar_PMAR012934 [Perkinsus marinus ATCC 50983]|uniref:GYF domain-containing protein n=1 Tax=Perkinsus marinus (strain ATCC 50983 / TXsc) TaxID=423536 RepID=C5LWK7_PERM5|nr:hypothetical protein Pmar_PMAR012934 [Perkinsus marinus ATCC 50983]EEQ98920.1 hypothetical protein Pmar_PMAR012934 [Perkinsus marinus ATCC 50983]|eukprot:XP_002766203.1 hypothetical protein Pmar_PMAR012934 [Perkinsus marinus ATCC 50983]
MGQDQSSPNDNANGGDKPIYSSEGPSGVAAGASKQLKAMSSVDQQQEQGTEGAYHRLTEKELDKLVYAQKNDDIDIYDLSVNRELKALLMTINDNDTTSTSSTTTLGGTKGLRKELSANAAEFIPGQFYGTVGPSRPQAQGQYGNWSKKNTVSQEDIAKKLSLQQRVEAITRASNAIPSGHKLWRYKDPRGTERGPFTFAEMRNWYEKGYFTRELEVTIREGGPFIKLGELYGPGHQPFSTKLNEAQVIVTCAALISSKARRKLVTPS